MDTSDITDQDSDMVHAVSTECLKRPWSFEADDVEGADVRGRKRAIRTTSEQSDS